MSFQERVLAFLTACFGDGFVNDKRTRTHRFLEEALELAQATHCTQEEAHQLVDYVYSRAVGECKQEVGGVQISLAALCAVQGLDMIEAGETELARVLPKIEMVRAKEVVKPQYSSDLAA